jgi:hypothetical protein
MNCIGKSKIRETINDEDSRADRPEVVRELESFLFEARDMGTCETMEDRNYHYTFP